MYSGKVFSFNQWHMKKITGMLFFVFFYTRVFGIYACTTCNRPLQQELFNEDSLSRILYLFLPFPLIAIMIASVYGAFVNEKRVLKMRSGPLIAAGLLLGMGLGGFLDGIILHQVLQWHQMISNVVVPDTLLKKEINMFWDGIFHLFTWSMTVIGLVLLWKLFFKKDVIISSWIFAGSLIMGWGIFNALDSIFNHYIFQLHNVREQTENPQLYNLMFLLFSVILLFTGWLLISSGKGMQGRQNK